MAAPVSRRPSLTRRGWTLAGASAGLFVGARVLGAGALSGLGIAGGVLLVFAAIIVLRGRPALSVARTARPARVHVGGSGQVILDGHTTARTPLLALTERVDGGRRSARFVLPPSPPGAPIRAAYRVSTLRRGHHELGPLLAVFADPFGLVRRGWVVTPPTDLVVRPRVHELLSPRRRTGGDPDPHAEGPRVPTSETAGEFLALRGYEAGDDPRRVSWRASARTGDLIVRLDEAAAPGRVVLLLDTRPEVHDVDSFEVAVEAIASLAVRCGKDQTPVEALTTAGEILGRPGPGTLELLLDRLAVVEVGGPDHLAALGAQLAARLGIGAVVVATGAPDRALVDAVAPLIRRSLAVIGTRAPSTARIPGHVDASTEPLPTAWNRAAAHQRPRWNPATSPSSLR
ncbi:MAG: DUF58 domain-containing protein [Acidimicrobiia bacterium]